MPTMQEQRVPARSPVHGLSRRRLPFVGVLAQSTAAVAPAGVISVIPALVLQASGANLLLTFGLAAAIAILVAACIRPLARRMAAVSGLYSYIARGLGPVAALFGGWSAVFGYALIGMTGLYAVGVHLTRVLAALGLPAGPLVAIGLVVAAAAGTTVAMLRGIRTTSFVVLLVEGVAIAILLTLLVASLLSGGAAGEAPRPDTRTDPGSIAVGVVLAIGGFVGFESVTTLGGEARRPLATIPRALMITTVGGGALYLVAVAFQEYALRRHVDPGPDGSLVSFVAAPHAAVVGIVIDLCVASSFLACAISSLNALVRVLFSMGREGVIPAAFGRTHPRFHSPSVALLATMPVVTAVPVVLLLTGVPADTALTWLLLLSSFGYIGSYLLACAAMPFFLRRIGELQPRYAWLSGTAVALVALIAVGATALHLANEPELPLIYLVVLCAAAVHAFALKRWRPARLRAVGVYDETIASDVLDAASLSAAARPGASGEGR